MQPCFADYLREMFASRAGLEYNKPEAINVQEIMSKINVLADGQELLMKAVQAMLPQMNLDRFTQQEGMPC